MQTEPLPVRRLPLSLAALAGLILLIPEPIRHGAKDSKPLPLAGAFAYLWSRRRDYAPLYIAATLMAVLSYGGLTWFPTHMIRSYGLTAGETGLILGLCQVVGPISGTILGTAMTEIAGE